jgi:PAS domain S-box-containing protein
MQHLVDSFDTPAYAVRANADLTIVAWNRAAERTFGWAADEVVGRPADERLRPTIGERARANRIEGLRRRGWWAGQAVLLDRDGAPVTVAGMCRPVIDGELRYLTVLHQIEKQQLAAEPLTRVSNSRFAGDATRASLHTMQNNEDGRYVAQVVGINIREARELAGLSQRQLAVMLEIDRRQLSDWERGIWQPRPHNLRKIAAALNQPLQDFYAEREVKAC